MLTREPVHLMKAESKNRGPATSRGKGEQHFLWLLSPPWDGVQTRQQHFARRLARSGMKVLYVENPPAWSSVLRQRNWRGASFFNQYEREIEPGLHVLRPAVSIPGTMRSDAIAALNGRLLARQLNKWFYLHDWTDYLAWCRVPACIFALKHLQPHRIAYDITDDYELYARHPGERERTAARETAMLRRADLVFVTAEELLRKPALQPANPFLLSNGVDYNLFAQAGEPGAIAPLLLGLKRPIVGYVGLTSHWMDFELLRKLAQRWPGQIVMVGPIQAQVEAQAKSIPGIVWAGFVPQPELPPYLRGMDVLIMPHKVNELRTRSNPLKTWECLATGKPFVTVDLPALNPARHLLHVAQNHDQFLELVTGCVKYDPPAAKLARQALATHYSWDALLEQLISNLLPAPCA